METPTSDTPRNRADARKHARRRAWERYGLILNRKARRSIETAIMFELDRHARCLGTQSDTKEVWLVKHDGKEYPVIFDSKLGCVLTFLPPHVIERRPDGKVIFKGYRRPTLRMLEQMGSRGERSGNG